MDFWVIFLTLENVFYSSPWFGRGDSYDHNEKSKFLVSEWKAEKYTNLENLSSKEEILWSMAK